MLMILSMLMKKNLDMFENTMPRIKEDPRFLHLMSRQCFLDVQIVPGIPRPCCGENYNWT